MMKKYRIGRIEGPWVNFEPPIRGGIFRPDTEDIESDSDGSNDTSDGKSPSLESRSSSSTSLESIFDASLLDEASATGRVSKVSTRPCELRSTSMKTGDPETQTLKAQHSANISRVTKDYTSSAEQQEIDDDTRNNPSLDADTQQDITQKYQALHQRVKDEDFYDCRYAEYGKEMIRYTLIFAAFIACLRSSWFMTSAALLGLFWVCAYPLVSPKYC